MAGTGWNAATAGPGVEVSVDGQTITRPTTGGGGTQAGIKGNAGRAKGRRYYEIEISANGCASGAADADADVSGLLGGGTAISFGYWAYGPNDGYLYYRFPNGDSGSISSAGIGGAATYGILIDFDAKTAEIYRDGVLQYTLVMPIPNDTVLYPAASIGTSTSATLQTVEPFQYPPESTFIAWDLSDAALASRVSGAMMIEGAPVARMLKAFSYERLTFDIDSQPITESKPLGQTISEASTGNYQIILRGGFERDVFVVAFDDYGEKFEASKAVLIGDRIHPTTPNGYVYDCTGSGTLPSSEPAWSQDTESDQLVGTASFRATAFYRPIVHGPIRPEVLNIGELIDPADWFSAGDIGATWDPSYRSSLFQDLDGLIPVDADGQTVALMLDRSGKGWHATQSNPSARPIYRTDGILHWLEAPGTAFMVIAGSKSAFNFLHNGGNSTFMSGFWFDGTSERLHTLIGGNKVSGSYYGMSLFYDHRPSLSVTRAIRYLAAFASGSVYGNLTIQNALPLETEAYIQLAINQAAGADLTISRDNEIVGTGNFAGGAYTGNASYDYELFSAGGGGSFVMKGRFYGATVINRALTTEEVQAASLYYQYRTGVL